VSIVAARAELIGALIAAGVRATDTPGGDPPYAYVTGDGTSDPSRVVTGQIEAAFRVVLVGGAWDEAAAARELDTLKDAFLSAVRDLDGWRFGAPIGRDGTREWAGGLYMTADAFANTLVDIA
jgi:hypothetical protein